MTGYDVVVVGGGTAGAVLAARLSEDPGRRVLLLEAGPAPLTLGETPPHLLDAGRVPGAAAGDPDSWWYPAQLLPGRDWAVSRGRVLGGSTATNGGYFVRPRRSDLERWSGGVGPWTWDRALPVMRAIERDLDLGDSPVHGDRGPVPVRRGSLDHPAAEAFVRAALQVGHSEEPDKNDEGAPGVGPVPSNAVDGVRWSTALTHLLPAAGRPNLVVRGETVVARVLLDRARATGIVLDSDERIEAGTVVLSAGALASPAILQRSGIGPGDVLRAAGVDPVLDAPAIGAALGDHPQVALEWSPPARGPRPVGSWMGAALHTADGTEVLQSLVPMGALAGGRAGAGAPLPLLVAAQAAEPAGSLRIVSPDPATPASIRFGYLGDDRARARLRDAVRTATEVVRAVPGARLAGAPEDDDLDGWIRAHLGTAMHTCGTVPFRLPDGSDGPVDDVGRVRGIDGLRVADTSILPSVPLRGPALSAVLVGEIVATSMREQGRPSPHDPRRSADSETPSTDVDSSCREGCFTDPVSVARGGMQACPERPI